MKKLFKVVAVAVLSLGFGVAAQAQSESAGVSVNAEVFDQIMVDVEESLNFGQIMTGTKKSVLPTSLIPISNGTGTASPSGVKVGRFRVDAGAGANVKLTFTTLPTVLEGETEDLPISYVNDAQGQPKNFAGWALGNTLTSTQTPFAPGSGYQFGNGANAAFPANLVDGANSIWVYIGGTIDATSVGPGEFSGTIVLEALYN